MWNLLLSVNNYWKISGCNQKCVTREHERVSQLVFPGNIILVQYMNTYSSVKYIRISSIYVIPTYMFVHVHNQIIIKQI